MKIRFSADNADLLTEIGAKEKEVTNSSNNFFSFITEKRDIVRIKSNAKITRIVNHGAQLFDSNKIQTRTQDDISVTNNGDGSFTIGGNGTATSNITFVYYITNKDEIKKLLKVGQITAKVERVTYPRFLFQLFSSNQTSALIDLDLYQTTQRTLNITQSVIDNCDRIAVGFTIAKGGRVTPGTISPMVYQDGNGTWERYRHYEIECDDYEIKVPTFKGRNNISVEVNGTLSTELTRYDYCYDGKVIDLSNNGMYLDAKGLDFGNVVPKTSYLEIEGADGNIDTTQLLTNDIKYENIKPTIKYNAFSMNLDENVEIQGALRNIFNGKIRRMYIDDWYLEGRFTMSPSFSRPITSITIKGDCYPYRMNSFESAQSYTVATSLNCSCYYEDVLPVCPTIICSAENMSIVYANAEYSLSQGENIVPDFILRKGNTDFTLKGNGTVTLKFRGGNL